MSTEQNEHPEAEIEKLVEDMTESREFRYYNFLINASNQANLVNTYNLSSNQVNALFVVVHPYYLDHFHLEDLNLEIAMTEEGRVLIDQQEFEPVEIKPGIRVFGLLKRNKE